MIVIAIIAAITALVISHYLHALGISKAGATEDSLKQIATAVDLYNIDTRQYPAGYGVTVTPDLFPSGSQNNYLPYLPQDGPDGPSFAYWDPLGSSDYIVCSTRNVPSSDIPNILTDAGAPPSGSVNLCYSPEYGVFAI